MTVPLPPDVEMLKKLLLGQLPVEEAERVAIAYADGSRLAELAEAIALPDDTLLTDLRNHRTIDDPNAELLVGRLVQRLRGTGTSDSSADDTLGAAAEGPLPGPEIPECLEYFRIKKVLGEGGMGTVFLADDTRLGRQVALKTLKRQLAANPAAKDRFIHEARSAARLEHDHIIPVHYVGEADGIPFLAMPFLQGEPLDSRIRRERAGGTLPPVAETIRIVGQIASGLAVAHSQGLIHRDIKPSNIWLEAPNGRVKILDFGLARSQNEETHLTASGAILGTPAYMAPEQARGAPIDEHADLFSLGCILYELLTGKRPFSGRDTMAILSSLALDTPEAPNKVNPNCPESLSRLTMQMLEKQPEQRPASARAIADALSTIAAANTEATAVPPAVSAADPNALDGTEQMPEVEPKLQKTGPRKRRRSPAIAAAVSLALAGVGIAYSGTIYRIAANQGELVVEIDDKDIEVKIVQGGLVVRDKTSKREFTLNAGKGEIEVLERDGVKLATKSFELNRGGRMTVRVTLDELTEARKPTVHPDRRAAEYVLCVGGFVGVNDQEREIKARSELPREAFRLTKVMLNDNKQVTDAGLACFNECRSLVWLGLNGTPVSDAGMAAFKDCKGLMVLELRLTNVGDAGLVHFKDCKNLRVIDLRETNLTDTGLAYFKDCKKLTVVCLNGTKVSDMGLAYFKDRNDLINLDLHGTQVGDAGLAHFKDCKKLTALGLGSTQVSDAGLAFFVDCKGMTHLDLNGTQVSDAGLANLKGCTSLTDLDLSGTQVTNAGLVHVKRWRNLTKLMLWSTQVTNAGLAQLKECENLSNLNLGGTQVSDAGLAHFKACKKLMQLDLKNTKVTAAGIEELKRNLPGCSIKWDGVMRE